MWRVEFHPEAYLEIEEPRSWYESNSPGLGMAFVDAVQKAVDAIQDSPDTHGRLMSTDQDVFSCDDSLLP